MMLPIPDAPENKCQRCCTILRSFWIYLPYTHQKQRPSPTLSSKRNPIRHIKWSHIRPLKQIRTQPFRQKKQLPALDAVGYVCTGPPKEEITRLSKNVADLTKQLQLQAKISFSWRKALVRSDFDSNDDVI